MASVDDVAAYILQMQGRMSAMKLEKLLYYAQAWSLVWDDRLLYAERIEAWSNGPVVPAIYEQHRGLFDVEGWPMGSAETLDSKARETVDAVLNFYGGHNAQWLSDLTHSERPWRDARVGLKDGERGDHEITLEALMEYYSSLDKNGKEY